IDNIGLSGLEFAYNDQLKGKAKLFKYLRDAKGRPIKFEGNFSENKAYDLYLSIDKDIQLVAEEALKEAVLKHNALKGGIGVLNANTGEVLAIGNYPTFDPNQVDQSHLENQKLAFISDPFEPGSTFKLFTVAAA